MADLPRWVDLDNVDSQAMLNAFLRYINDARRVLEKAMGPGLSWQPTFEGHLWSIVHQDPPWMTFMGAQAVHLSNIPERPCTQRACSRCNIKGGWQFKWFSPYWVKLYNEQRRPGSWTALEPEVWYPDAHDLYWNQHLRFWYPVLRRTSSPRSSQPTAPSDCVVQHPWVRR